MAGSQVAAAEHPCAQLWARTQAGDRARRAGRSALTTLPTLSGTPQRKATKARAHKTTLAGTAEDTETLT